MKLKILSMLSFFVLTMAVAYPWHMLLFESTYQAMGVFTREAPIMGLGMLAIGLQGWAIAFVFPYFYQNKTGSPIKLGIQFSLIMGLLVYSVMVFATAAKFMIEPVWQFVMYGTAFQIIQFVMTGAALGWIHRKEINNS